MNQSNKCLILLTKGVSEYRATIPKYINKRDVVLEIGFAWGTTTNLLSKHSKKVVGIDKGESFYTAVKNDPHDVSECRSLFQFQKMILMYSHAFKPELIVVKSSKLKRFVLQCEVWNR